MRHATYRHLNTHTVAKMATASNSWLPEALFKFDNLETHVQDHLKNVYSTLAIGMLSAAVGAYIHLAGIFSAGLLSLVASIGLMIWLFSTVHTKEEMPKRLAIFAGFTFCSGMSLGPLLDFAIMIDPSIVATALMGTFVVFGSFSLAALLNTNRAYIFMGGTLMSCLSWLCLLGFLNIFFRSQLLFDLNLYLGLAVFCAFVLYDTQLIVEKRRLGDEDFIWHSVDLFLDFINIFRRLLILLSKKESDKKKRRD